ncbi:MAG: DUF1902 domain-containing protein [Gammaproteobacteria bacterium]|nr:DUF1902 domain-containing protein [Gammaproteobacteria bacterium]
MDSLEITISVFVEDGVWTGICDEIGLVAEADSEAELRASIRDLVPELVALNGEPSKRHHQRASISYVDNVALPEVALFA